MNKPGKDKDKKDILKKLGLNKIKNALPVIQESEKEKEKMLPSTDDFIAKTEEEVIRVPNCTYANNNKQAKYFLCTCTSSTKGFEPICEACALLCHKTHHPTLEVSGVSTMLLWTYQSSDHSRDGEHSKGKNRKCSDSSSMFLFKVL